MSTELSAQRDEPGGELRVRHGDEPSVGRLPVEDVLVLRRAVGVALDRANSRSAPRDRARAQAGLLGLLQDLVVSVTAARDAALAEMFVNQPGASNRALAKQLNLSRQRVDQLRRHVRAGGRRSGL